jgi:peptide/nickel transport system permease protein
MRDAAMRGALGLKEHTYIEGARAAGSGHLQIAGAHILPNVLATIIVVATTGLSTVILTEASLSFLGLGVPPPYPTWGGMLSLAGLDHMYQAPWLAIWPAVALSLAVFGFNMLGDALRDRLDPRLKGGGEHRRGPRRPPRRYPLGFDCAGGAGARTAVSR